MTNRVKNLNVEEVFELYCDVFQYVKDKPVNVYNCYLLTPDFFVGGLRDKFIAAETEKEEKERRRKLGLIQEAIEL